MSAPSIERVQEVYNGHIAIKTACYWCHSPMETVLPEQEVLLLEKDVVRLYCSDLCHFEAKEHYNE